MLLTERKSLLNSALIAVVEALRMNPDKYAIIYNSKYDNDSNLFDKSNNTIVTAISSPSPSTKVHQNYYYNEYHEGLVEKAKTFLKILLNQLVDKTVVAAVKKE